MTNIKAVIFDVDNTLVDRKEAFIRFCRYFIDTYAKDYPFPGSVVDMINYMVKIDENGYSGLDNFLANLKKRWELPLLLQDFIKERNEVFGKLSIPYPELFEVLDALKEKYILGIITNGYSGVQRDKIDAVHMAHYFADIVVSGEHPFEKPDTRIFELSCSNLGIQPEEAIYVGDYYPNDIAGAMGAKITPIWINDDPNEHLEYTGLRVKQLKDILAHLL